MKRIQSLISGLDRILSVREASDLLSISVDELLKYYTGQREISLRNLRIKICRSNPIYHFLIIGELTYTLKGVKGAFMVVMLSREEQHSDLVSGCPIPLLQD